MLQPSGAKTRLISRAFCQAKGNYCWGVTALSLMSMTKEENSRAKPYSQPSCCTLTNEKMALTGNISIITNQRRQHHYERLTLLRPLPD